MRRRIVILLLGFAAISMGAVPHRVRPPQDAEPAANENLFEVFKSQIFPLFSRDDGGCFDCHSTGNSTDLIFSGDAEEDFNMLVDGKYLEESGPDSVLGRLTSQNKKLRMPQDAEPWPRKEIDRLSKFVKAIKKSPIRNNIAVDERFPRALLKPYRGQTNATFDNQFISYRQLKAKVAVIFADDWVRGEKDLFAENIALFGGVDFKTRFNETRVPSAAFLTGLELLAKDVAHFAFENKRGPFAQFSEMPPPSLDTEKVPLDYRKAIVGLYERVLYRNPTEIEIDDAYKLLQGIYRSRESIVCRDHQLSFELTVTDRDTGWQQKRIVDLPVSGDRLEIHQQIVDQSKTSGDEEKPTSSCIIGPAVRLIPNREKQRLVVHNIGTHQNVSFAGVQLIDVNAVDEKAKKILVTSPLVQVDGAWQLENKRGTKSLEDRNNHKGQSTITVPLKVKEAGEYRVKFLWRTNAGNANNVLVELFADGAGNQLASPQHATIPELGESHFFYDCGNDSEPFFQPNTAFQFDNDGFVQISNRGTRRRVTAGAVEFLDHADSSRRFLIDSRQALGNEKWSQYNEGQFKAYNVKGKKLHDNNKQKGELSLTYALAVKDPDSDSYKKTHKAWDAEKLYDVRIYYPGKVNHETQVPVVVQAAKSSPIIQLKHPLIAKSDAQLRLDASNSYTVQHSELQFAWRQISGAPVDLIASDKPVIEFTVPRPNIQQFAWSSLCAALIRHPDFTFTRPPSLYKSASQSDKRKMQLVKIALDLVGRPPNSMELEKLQAGVKLSDLIDHYLDSNEFRDDYFQRVRLMLESHGTELDDEPARLWSFVAFNDLPFQEILTADYTVDNKFKKQSRPDYHGQTGLLTTSGFIRGKPGLPHYNYAAQVAMLFLGYVFEVPDEIVEQREGVTALGTTDPNSVCYSCHKILTPLAFQRLNWDDEGKFRARDENDVLIDASDRGAVAEYPFAGNGLQAFATKAVRKERFIRAIINTHVNFYFGRPLRHRYDERVLYKKLWDHVHKKNFKIRELLRAIMNSPEYLNGGTKPALSK